MHINIKYYFVIVVIKQFLKVKPYFYTELRYLLPWVLYNLQFIAITLLALDKLFSKAKC